MERWGGSGSLEGRVGLSLEVGGGIKNTSNNPVSIIQNTPGNQLNYSWLQNFTYKIKIKQCN